MATDTRYKPEVQTADVDILVGISYDRAHLRFAGIFAPSRYLYEEDGVTHKKNAAGEKAIEIVAGSYTFFPTLETIFKMQSAAETRLRTTTTLTMDTVMTTEWEKLRNDAVAKWDKMVADYKAAVTQYNTDKAAWDAADPATRGPEPTRPTEPTVDALCTAAGCTHIDGDHPFRL